MNILWHSNSGHAPTGYGVQTGLFVPRLRDLGHHMTTSNFWGLNGAPIKMNDIWHYPAGRDMWGNDTLAADALHNQADIVITLMDIWILKPSVTRNFRWCPWLPIDHDPVTPSIQSVLKTAYQPIAYSRWGQERLADAGYEALYVPHGVDTGSYYPMDRKAAREMLGCPEDRFLVGIVAANKGYPSRKCFDQQIRAFKRLHDKHADVMLYLHTDLMGQAQGENINAVLVGNDVPAEAVAVVDQYLYNRGLLTPEYMCHAYNAMDVLSNASRGEGFGLPILEAQACGTPVIVTDFSAMPELCFAGWKVSYDDKFFSQDSYQVSPSGDAIYEAMEAAYQLGETGCQQLGASGLFEARAYDVDVVTADYWKPVLEQIAARVEDDKRKWQVAIGQMPDACKDGHDWAHIGAKSTDGKILIPCKRQGCPASREIANGIATDRPTGFEMVVDGEALDIEDDPQGGVAKIVWHECVNSYKLDTIPLVPGDVVLDIGAHVGVVSIWLAKHYPKIRLYAYEPCHDNYERLNRNLMANGIMDYEAEWIAVTGDGRTITLHGDPHKNTGGYSAFVSKNGANGEQVDSFTLQHIFAWVHPDSRIKLLKIDCEGAEYEILTANPELLRRVDWIVGEFHINDRLREMGYDPDELRRFCEQYVGGGRVIAHTCEIAD